MIRVSGVRTYLGGGVVELVEQVVPLGLGLAARAVGGGQLLGVLQRLLLQRLAAPLGVTSRGRRLLPPRARLLRLARRLLQLLLKFLHLFGRVFFHLLTKT